MRQPSLSSQSQPRRAPRQVEAGEDVAPPAGPGAAVEGERAADPAERRRLAADDERGDGLLRRWEFQGEAGAGERGPEREAAVVALDPRQFAGGPVAADLGELHPVEVVVVGRQAGDHVAEDGEADALAVEVEPLPVAD